jgi:tRNA pseudouridine38-40 synthase
MAGEPVSVVGSGRTDSGVHSVGQVAHFILKKKFPEPWVIQRGLNGILDASIRVISAWEVPLEFHAQRSAQKKQYSYYFQQGACPLPQLEPFTWWIQKQLQLEAMQESLEYLKGEHDFKPFQASGAKPGPTVRRILEAQVTLEPISFPGFSFDFLRALQAKQTRSDFGLVRVRLVGTGFLKQMVRGIAGTLLQVGEGRRNPICIREILESRDRLAVGPTAPGRALWLERVWYSELDSEGLHP